MILEELLRKIVPADQAAAEQCWQRWDAIAKPLRSLGILEKTVVKIAGMQRSAQVTLGKRAVIVMCADNGVVAEGVTQTGQEVTAIVAENMTRLDTSVCRMAKVAGVDVVPVDIGVARPLCDGVLNRCIRRGTGNIAKEPAMTHAECRKAILTGAQLVFDLHAQGYGLFATGEMGIGNTTTSSAVVSVLLDKAPQEVTGRGAGLSSDGLTRKIAAIEAAIQLHRPNASDPVDVLAKVGGLDIAGLVGVFLGAAACKAPVLVDGFISAAAALIAVRLCPAAADYQLASHVSKEPAAKMVLNELGLTPMLYADMCLGEGTGAMAVVPLLDMALSVYDGMTTFENTNIESYVPLD